MRKVGHGLHIHSEVFRRYSQSPNVAHVATALGYRQPVLPQSMVRAAARHTCARAAPDRIADVRCSASHAPRWTDIALTLTVGSDLVWSCSGPISPCPLSARTLAQYLFKQPLIGAQVSSHQDSTFLYTEPRPTCLGLWLALHDATRENGCLWVRRGSHAEPVRSVWRRNPEWFTWRAQNHSVLACGALGLLIPQHFELCCGSSCMRVLSVLCGQSRPSQEASSTIVCLLRHLSSPVVPRTCPRCDSSRGRHVHPRNVLRRRAVYRAMIVQPQKPLSGRPDTSRSLSQLATWC